MSDPKSSAPADAAARARAIIEAQLAKKRGHGEAHERKVSRESRTGKTHSQTTLATTRPDGRGKRG